MPNPMPGTQLLKQLARLLVIMPVALILLFEEWGWEPLAAGFAKLGKLPFWAWLERRVTALPPWAALLAFFGPMLALVPVKLLALYLFGEGKVGKGLCLLIGAKLLGTAMAARLFQLTQPALMRLTWFARLYNAWKGWKNRLLWQVRRSLPWRTGRRLKVRARYWARNLRAAFSSSGTE